METGDAFEGYPGLYGIPEYCRKRKVLYGLMPDKEEKSIGVYHLRSGRQAVTPTPIGGQGNPFLWK